MRKHRLKICGALRPQPVPQHEDYSIQSGADKRFSMKRHSRRERRTGRKILLHLSEQIEGLNAPGRALF
jgi:hypothetical protein